jgi:hypothetical protein
MKLLANTIIVSLLLICNSLLAHPDGHDKPQAIYKQQAIEAANYYRNGLIEKGTLDQQWKQAKVSKSELKRVEYRNSWIITYTSGDNKSLDIMMTSSGDFISHEEHKVE